MIVFGPIPSRRLGKSLGVNNIPPKVCTQSCVYCQICLPGRVEAERRAFYDPPEILREVRDRVGACRRAGEAIDFISFVPDGEPTLDANLGREIELIKPQGIRIAVLTNGTLLYDENVRRDLGRADWVGVKIDAATETLWRAVNRPHSNLTFERFTSGAVAFAREFRGELTTQTMLVKGYNDGESEIARIGDLVKQIAPCRAFISVPTRPPAEKSVLPASADAVNVAYQVFAGLGLNPELITGFEGSGFATTGRIEDDILGIVAVHPMREDSLRAMLAKAGSDWTVIEHLQRRGLLREVEFMDNKFYIREFGASGRRPASRARSDPDRKRGSAP